jgi:hypothetical protein
MLRMAGSGVQQLKPAPPGGPGFGARALALLGAILGVMYLLNPGAGVFELLPDNLPFVGNLDEVGATMLVANAIRVLRASRRAVK